MPHLPDVDPRQHATHDRTLVAAYAAGDATGRELETATALVARCPHCAALHHDLRAIAAALPALPAPARTRDFTLTQAQAASLRPAGWRRWLGTAAGPRFRLATPLGAGLATLGVAGLLFAAVAGTPLVPASGSTAAGTTAADAAAPEFTVDGASASQPAAASAASSAAPSAAASAAPIAAAGVQPSPVGGAVAAPVAPDAGASGSTEITVAPVVPAASAKASEVGPPEGRDPAAGQAADGATAAGDRALRETVAPSSDPRLPLVAAAAVVLGLVLLAIRWAARRLA